MNRGELREDLRLLLQEEVEDDYSDNRLNTLLLIGLRRLERYVLKINPQAFVSIYVADIIDASSDPDRLKLYNWPEGTIRPLNVKRRATPADKYVPLPKLPYSLVNDEDTKPSQLGWSPWGQHFFALEPPPSAAIDDGLLVEVVEHLSMAEDTDVPDVALGLHDAIPLLAKRRALLETEQPLSREEKEQLAEILAEIPSLYDPASGGPSFIQPRVYRAY
jgi:hypothetical protein